MTMNMIEKIARAMHNYAVSVGAVSPQWTDYENVPKLHNDHLLNTVKAALEAMKEPTEEMMEAARNHYSSPTDLYLDSREHFQAMIDAALEGK
jgi:hypothetical protein